MRSIARVLPALLLMLSAVACHSDVPSLGSVKIPKGAVTHVVVMWLYDRADATARTEVLGAGRKLEEIPGVVTLVAGRVLTSERPVVDSTYDIAFVLTFKTEDDMRRYLENPIHVETKKNILDRYVKKYVAYDFVAE